MSLSQVSSATSSNYSTYSAPGNYYNLDAVYSSPSTEKKKEEDPLGKNAFLTMLIAQLKNQDPLNPQEGTQFATQLAQFSSLEQQFNANNTLSSILKSLEAKSDGNLIDYIGKEVLTQNNNIIVSEGAARGGSFTIDQPASTTVIVSNKDGLEVRRINLGNIDPGTHNIQWDGRDNSGKSVADGSYSYEVVAESEGGTFVPVKTTVSGEVTGVTYQNGIPYLMLNDTLISPSSVIKVLKVSEQVPASNETNQPATSSDSQGQDTIQLPNNTTIGDLPVAEPDWQALAQMVLQ
ncbi:MAG: hypothetical protein HQK77_05410 [Desulfobacterales bacterium]|nr:hypothetical protein [Desulfobacterales bacterium]